MNFTKIGLTATVAGAMGAAALGLGAGTAQADHNDWWEPHIPYVDVHIPPGHVGHIVHVPPGQLKKWIPGPDVPPGHWGRW
ncbi:hypothetical protein [Mycobacterium sp. GA-2829]|uniref:hypothetical protein n=1 Tax=Mycobacterium sp. GA-2829 TaxID=1772283 RepID=UPI00073FA8B6|nr:hypothetical protein [Mycobacterium sp. GA-2829]KUI25242.1 hypothetical protein AU194_04425 [Mycobacterium sp. GA-2829]